MATHKFKVGRAVTYTPGKLAMPPSAGEYKVIRCLPVSGQDLMYRIKSASEAFERVARESELA